jgi:Putative peptidoglycan binding domain
VNHTFAVPAETRGFEDHTGFNPSEGRALEAFQSRYLMEKWADPYCKPTGLYDMPTKNAIIRIQHHARFEMNGRLDEKTWDYAQEISP